MKSTVFLLLMFMCCLPVFSRENDDSLEITGRVVIVKDGRHEDIPYADIAVMQLPDSVFVTGTVSDGKGGFCVGFQCLPEKRYMIRVSYMGCKDSYSGITDNGTGKSVDLGTICLEEDAEVLEGTVVTAVRQPVEQKKDTTIVNAEAFKVPEGSVLEALVKRIPGLSYDSKSKTITYKGETIKEIIVNGKDFFKGNSRVALENLPADFVSRIKVYDKATEEEEARGVKDSDKYYVLDLQTKKDMSRTWMSVLEGGYGNKNKYHTNLQLYRFDENGDNIGVFGTLGNKYFNTPYKGNRSGNTGGNIAKKLNDKLQLSASVNYSDSKSGNSSTSRNELYMTDGNQYGASSNSSESKNGSLSSNVNMMWNIDERTMLHVSGGVNWGHSGNSSFSRSAGFDENPGLDLFDPFGKYDLTDRNIRVYESLQNNSGKSANIGLNIMASLIRRLGKDGNSIGFYYTSSMSDNDMEAYNVFNSTFYKLHDSYGRDSVEYRHQYQASPAGSFNNGFNFDYTFKIAEKSNVRLAYALNFQTEKQLQDTYDLTPFEDMFDKGVFLPEGYESHLVDSLSNKRKENNVNNNFSVNYGYQNGNWNIQGYVSAFLQRRNLCRDGYGIAIDTVGLAMQWAPSLFIAYNDGEYDINIRYSGNTRQPSLNELMSPTVYNTATYVSRGNPDLKSSYGQNVNFYFSNFDRGLSFNLNSGQQFNDIAQATLYDPDSGCMETFPVNINGNWNVFGNANYDRRFGDFRVTGRAGGNYNHNVGLVNGNESGELEKSVTKSSGINTFVESSYLPEWGNIDLNAAWDFQMSRNSMNPDKGNTITRNWSFGAVVSAELPYRIRIDSDFRYNLRSGTYVDSGEENEALWNIRLAWKFLKERKAEISLTWTDILDQQKSLYRGASYNGFHETYSEQLGSYFIVSLKYNLNIIR